MIKPRVLFVSPVSNFKGGAEVVLRHMMANPAIEPVLAVPEEGPVSEAARAQGITVCCYRPTAMLQVHRPPRLRPILAAVADAVRCAFRLKRFAEAQGCSLIHSNGLKTHVLCAIIGLLTDAPTLVHLHDIPYRRSERVLWKLIAGCVSKVVIVSRPCFPSETLPEHVAVVHNGIRMLQDSLPSAPSGGPLRLGFVGRFHPNKGMDVLIDWFASIRARGVDAKLTIRGRPDPDMPDYWTEIQHRLAAEGLTPHVHHDGWVTGTATYAGLDMLLVTSKTPDPLPLVVLEAMSAGVVVAGYAAGGVPEMIEHGRTGLLATDQDELAEQVAALWADPDRFARLRAAAYEHVRSQFSLDRFHRRLLEIYQSAPARRPAAIRRREEPGLGAVEEVR